MAPDAEFRPDIPSTARMYDYYLGGKDNYPADREAAEAAIRMMPEGVVRTAAVQNRQFLGRAVRYLAHDAGIRQFLDIGTGLPTMNSVHEVAQKSAPDSRVVYVDHDPIVITHARDMLHSVPNTTILRHDLRQPRAVLGDPELESFLDLSQPLAVLLVAILHFVTDEEDPQGIVDTLIAAVPAGSYLVISHFTSDSYAQAGGVASQVYEGATSSMHSRTHGQISRMFGGLDLVEPGVVLPPRWRPDAATDPGDKSLFWCGVARKR